jgi:hypothetical protein
LILIFFYKFKCICPYQINLHGDGPCSRNQLRAHGGTRLLPLLPDLPSHERRVVMGGRRPLTRIIFIYGQHAQKKMSDTKSNQ